MKWNKLNCVLKVLDTESDPDAGNLVAQQPFFLNSLSTLLYIAENVPQPEPTEDSERSPNRAEFLQDVGTRTTHSSLRFHTKASSHSAALAR